MLSQKTGTHLHSVRAIVGEVQRRRIPAILAIYGAGSFGILEAIDDLSGRFEWPANIFDIALVLFLVGTLNIAVAAWFHGAAHSQRWQRRELLLHAVPILIAGGIFVGSSHTEDRVLDPRSLVFTGFETVPETTLLADSLELDLAALLRTETGILLRYGTDSTAATILSGRIGSLSGRLRITAELTDAETGVRIWSETFEREPPLSGEDRHMVSARIASSVAILLNRLTGEN